MTAFVLLFVYVVLVIQHAISASVANVSQSADHRASSVTVTPSLESTQRPDNTTTSSESNDSISGGTWERISGHDPAGGVIRVSDDGPKPDILADPTVDIGWDSRVTSEMITQHPNYRYLSRLSECGYAMESDEPNIEGAEFEEGTTTEKLATGQDDGSGGKRNKRIVGGQVVPPHKHPWMVQLYLYNLTSAQHDFHCAGTLISNSTILTASHCLTRLSPGSTLDVVVVGNIDRRKLTFCKTSNPDEFCSRDQMIEIEDMQVHEGYNEGDLNNDIALIYLKKPIKFNANVRPICLPFSSKLLDHWKDLKVTGVGWGATNKYPSDGVQLSQVLKYVQFDLQPRSLCDKFHVRVYGTLKANRICTGGNTNRASCNGDSGGPVIKALVVPDSKEGKVERVFQFGIVSAGGHPLDTCGFQGRPAIDTNVFYHMDWILNHITPGVSSYRNVRFKENNLWILEDQRVESQYANEFSTGQDVDVSLHPNVGLLPKFNECGNLPKSWKSPMPSENEFIKPKPQNDSKTIPDPNKDEDDEKSNRRNKRIVGGVPLNLDGFYPWMAQIYVRNVGNQAVGFRCSGTIISSRAILTAAHCVTEIQYPFVFDHVAVGQYNRNTTEECIDNECFSSIRVKIEDIAVHAEYEKYTHKNNIAVIRLLEDLNFTRMVQPICLPRKESLINGIMVERYFTVGWGRVVRENKGPLDRMSKILLQMYVNILPRQDCDFVYSRTIDRLDRSRLCGGGKASQGECLGDGGSPLMKKLTLDQSHPLYNKIFQLGIVAFSDCGMQGMPAVYMNIIYYMDWILNNLDR